MVKNPMDGSNFLITVPLGTGPGLQANHLEIARLMQKKRKKKNKEKLYARYISSESMRAVCVCCQAGFDTSFSTIADALH